MAALTVDFLNTVTDSHKMKGLIDNIWDDSFLGKRLFDSGNIKYQEGDPFEAQIEYSKAKKGGAYSKYDSKTYAIREFATQLKYDRKFYSEEVILYDRDLDVNKGAAQIVDILTNTVRSAYNNVRDSVFTDLFRLASVTPDVEDIKLNSLEDLFNQTSTTAFGNLAANQFSGWAASVDSTTALAALTQTLYKTILRGVYKGAGRMLRPTIGVTTQAIWNKIESLEISKQLDQYKKDLNLGKESITIDGIPIVVDTFQNAGYLDFLNEDYIKLFINSNDNFNKSSWEKSQVKRAMISDVTLTANFGCTRRDVHARMSALV